MILGPMLLQLEAGKPIPIYHSDLPRDPQSLKGSEFLENFWFLNIQLSVMIVNGSALAAIWSAWLTLSD